MVNKIGETAQTTATSKASKPQSKPQAQSNIVIEFTSLPEKLKTKEVRAFYDKDGSAFLESKNSNGQNEIALMKEFAQSMGIDLMKYKSDIVKTNAQTHVGIDAQGNVIRRVSVNRSSILYDTYSAGYMENKDGSTQSRLELDANYKPTGSTRTWVNQPNGRIDKRGVTPMENGMVCHSHENFGPNGTHEEWNDTIYDKNGKVLATYQTKSVRKDKNGEEEYKTISEKYNVYEEKQLTKGKNNLVLHRTYNAEGTKDSVGLSEFPQKTSLESETMTLNGKKVQAKPIGKGRYEVTTEKGNVYYISHDGKILKPEYVRTNP